VGKFSKAVKQVFSVLINIILQEKHAPFIKIQRKPFLSFVSILAIVFNLMLPFQNLALAGGCGAGLKQASFSLDGIRVEVCSAFMPDPSFVAPSYETNSDQSASSIRHNPYQEFSVIAVPFGTVNFTEGLPEAKSQGAGEYLIELKKRRAAQGDTNPLTAPEINIFGQDLPGIASIIQVNIDGPLPKPILVLDYVTEFDNRIWIVRLIEDLEANKKLNQPLPLLSLLGDLSISAISPNRPSTSAVKEPLAPAPKPQITAAGDYPPPPWWNGNTCDSSFYNARSSKPAVLYHTYRGIQSCGPRPHYDGVSDVSRSFGDGVEQLEWECAELSKRFMKIVYGVSPYSADGSQVVDYYTGNQLEKITNSTPGKAPMEGDIISYGTVTPGHTSVVIASAVDGNGNGQITVMEQNDTTGFFTTNPGVDIHQVVGWVVKANHGGAQKWLHKNTSITHEVPPDPQNAVIVDNGGSGFSTGSNFGTPQYMLTSPCSAWECRSSSTNYTTNTGRATDNNYAVWETSLPQSGRYEVLASIPNKNFYPNTTSGAHYHITDKTGQIKIFDLNQSSYTHGETYQWVSLQFYDFNAGPGAKVTLGDKVPETGNNAAQILIDAIAFRFVSPPPNSLTRISVSPVSPSVQRGGTQQFTAMGYFSDGSQLSLTSTASWSTDNSGVASVNGNGLATGVGIGNTTIRASQSGQTGTATLIVNPPNLTAITVLPTSTTILQGSSQQFAATGFYSDGTSANISNNVSWVSDNSTIASINASGVAIGVGAGSTTVHASLAAQTGSASLNITALAPASPSNLTVSSSTGRSISLAWTNNANNQTGFKIYRWNGFTGIFDYLDSVGATTYGYTDNQVNCLSDSYYMVSAFNGSAESDRVGWVKGTTTACLAPYAPSNITPIAVSSESIDVSWTDNSAFDHNESQL